MEVSEIKKIISEPRYRHRMKAPSREPTCPICGFELAEEETVIVEDHDGNHHEVHASCSAQINIAP